MSKDFRCIDPVSQHRICYTCENRVFRTELSKGHPHGIQEARGSVHDDALLWSSDRLSLWLEHVISKKTGREVFWLMWYDPDGKPTIPMSGVFSHEEFEQMVGRLTRFIG